MSTFTRANILIIIHARGTRCVSAALGVISEEQRGSVI